LGVLANWDGVRTGLLCALLALLFQPLLPETGYAIC